MGTLESDVTTVYLSDVLSGPYRLAYAIPLLVLSVPITFAAAFLTLDRTRTFIPVSTTGSAPPGRPWQFQGGIGGMLGGWAFGVHLSTFLALLIMNRTATAELGSIQFLVIWVISSVALSTLASRFKIAAIMCLAIGGGSTFSIFLSVITHPVMLARVILLGIFAIILAILALVPIPNVRHGAVRFGGASLGAFGVILGSSLLARATSWENVWARLWVSSSADWGTAQEKGLSAAYAVLTCIGVVTDWVLKRKLGENPDERWDSYLASYAANLPNARDRPGTFRPAVGFWKRLTNPPPKDPITFPPDTALGKRVSTSDPLFRPAKLKTRAGPRPSSQTKFKPLAGKGAQHSSGSSSSSSDSEIDIPRPWAKRSSSSRASLSGATLSGSQNDSKTGKGKRMDMDAEYSDGESVVRGNKGIMDRDTPGWKPEFLKRHSSTKSSDIELGLKKPRKEGKGGSLKHDEDSLASPPSPTSTRAPPPGAVPVTPSLIKALDRVSRAQSEVYGAGTPGPQTPPTTGGYEWGAFWRTVGDKAKESDASLKPAP